MGVLDTEKVKKQLPEHLESLTVNYMQPAAEADIVVRQLAGPGAAEQAEAVTLLKIPVLAEAEVLEACPVPVEEKAVMA